MQYAAETSVPVEKTRAEIESVVGRYGAVSFGSLFQPGSAMVCFEMRDRQIRFVLPLPDKATEEFTHQLDGRTRRMKQLPPEAVQKKWEQACRQRWRALLLAIKAKLEAVECKISTFDSEFLSNIVQSNGLTIGESILPKMPEILAGKMPPLMLPSPVN